MAKGEVLTIECLESKKPANMGIPASKFQQFLGMKLKLDKNQYEFLKLDLED